MVPSIYSETPQVTGDSAGANFYSVLLTLHLELQDPFQIITRVMEYNNKVRIMLWRSAHVQLAFENEHIEGSMHLEAKTVSNMPNDPPTKNVRYSSSSKRNKSIWLDNEATLSENSNIFPFARTISGLPCLIETHYWFPLVVLQGVQKLSLV